MSDDIDKEAAELIEAWFEKDCEDNISNGAFDALVAAVAAWARKREAEYITALGVRNDEVTGLSGMNAELKAERDAAHVAGMREALELCDGLPDGIDCSNAIDAAIKEREG